MTSALVLDTNPLSLHTSSIAGIETRRRFKLAAFVVENPCLLDHSLACCPLDQECRSSTWETAAWTIASHVPRDQGEARLSSKTWQQSCYVRGLIPQLSQPQKDQQHERMARNINIAKSVLQKTRPTQHNSITGHAHPKSKRSKAALFSWLVRAIHVELCCATWKSNRSPRLSLATIVLLCLSAAETAKRLCAKSLERIHLYSACICEPPSHINVTSVIITQNCVSPVQGCVSSCSPSRLEINPTKLDQKCRSGQRLAHIGWCKLTAVNQALTSPTDQ